MTHVNKAELRRLAEAAAHKDWYAGNAYDKPFILKYQIITDTPDGKYVLLDGNQNFPDDCVANVAFVGAASPSVVLSLLNSEAQAKCEAGHAIQQKDAAYAECKALRTELERTNIRLHEVATACADAEQMRDLFKDRVTESVRAYNHYRNKCRRLEDALNHRFALYSRADKLGLAADRGQPVALFACRATAEAHGRKLYGEMAEVVELSAEQELAP